MSGKLDGRKVFTVTIPQGASVSNAAAIGPYSVLGVVLPTGAGSFEASTDTLYFDVSDDGTTYGYLADKDETLEYITVAAANTYAMRPVGSPANFAPFNFVRVVAYEAGVAAVVQATAARTIKLICGIVIPPAT